MRYQLKLYLTMITVVFGELVMTGINPRGITTAGATFVTICPGVVYLSSTAWLLDVESIKL